MSRILEDLTRVQDDMPIVKTKSTSHRQWTKKTKKDPGRKVALSSENEAARVAWIDEQAHRRRLASIVPRYVGPTVSQLDKREHVNAWAEWLQERLDRTPGSQAFLLTFTCDPFRAWYHAIPSQKGASHNRVHVGEDHIKAGYAVRLPGSEHHKQLIADVESWYVREMKRWFGWKWTKLKDLQPRGAGSLDIKTLAGKSGLDAYEMKRDASDTFVHAHVVVVVENLAFTRDGEQTNLVDFVKCPNQQRWMKLQWTGLHPLGHLDIRELDHVDRPLSYSTKAASRLGLDNCNIVLPAIKAN